MTSELDNALQKTVILKVIHAMASTSATLSGYHSSVGPEKYNWSSQFSLKFENVLMTATAWLGGGVESSSWINSNHRGNSNPSQLYSPVFSMLLTIIALKKCTSQPLASSLMNSQSAIECHLAVKQSWHATLLLKLTQETEKKKKKTIYRHISH